MKIYDRSLWSLRVLTLLTAISRCTLTGRQRAFSEPRWFPRWRQYTQIVTAGIRNITPWTGVVVSFVSAKRKQSYVPWETIHYFITLVIICYSVSFRQISRKVYVDVWRKEKTNLTCDLYWTKQTLDRCHQRNASSFVRRLVRVRMKLPRPRFRWLRFRFLVSSVSCPPSEAIKLTQISVIVQYKGLSPINFCFFYHCVNFTPENKSSWKNERDG